MEQRKELLAREVERAVQLREFALVFHMGDRATCMSIETTQRIEKLDLELIPHLVPGCLEVQLHDLLDVIRYRDFQILQLGDDRGVPYLHLSYTFSLYSASPLDYL